MCIHYLLGTVSYPPNRSHAVTLLPTTAAAGATDKRSQYYIMVGFRVLGIPAAGGWRKAASGDEQGVGLDNKKRNSTEMISLRFCARNPFAAALLQGRVGCMPHAVRILVCSTSSYHLRDKKKNDIQMSSNGANNVLMHEIN